MWLMLLLGWFFWGEWSGEVWLPVSRVQKAHFLSDLSEQQIAMSLGEDIRSRHIFTFKTAVVSPRGWSMKRHGQQI